MRSIVASTMVIWATLLVWGCQAANPRAGVPAASERPTRPQASGSAHPAPATDRDVPVESGASDANESVSGPVGNNPVGVETKALDKPAGASSEVEDAGEARILRPGKGIEVDPDAGVVRLHGIVCIEAGWLEQIACSPNTREYEALVVLPQPASLIHASLLMAGFEAGRPGGWSWNEHVNDVDFIEPQGTRVRIEFEFERDGAVVREPAQAWIRDHMRRQQFPDEPWVFGGSKWVKNNAWMRQQTGKDEHYEADMTGSIIGLVTFGDEVLGYSRVLADDATIQPPEWEVDTDRIPPIGTPVTIVISRWDEQELDGGGTALSGDG